MPSLEQLEYEPTQREGAGGGDGHYVLETVWVEEFEAVEGGRLRAVTKGVGARAEGAEGPQDPEEATAASPG